MVVNNGRQLEALWRQSKRLDPTVTRKEFNKAIRAFQRIYGEKFLPRKITKIDVPGLSKKTKILLKFGNVPEILYTTDFGRKNYDDDDPIHWVHETKGEMLLVDPDNPEVKILYGKTRVNDEGWLED